MKKLVLLAIVGACSALFAAGEYKIAALYWSMNIKGQVAMREGLEAEAALINAEAAKSGGKKITLIKYVAGDGEKGIENQIAQFKDAMTQKVDAIVVQPTDNAALGGALQWANGLGIPVIAYDQYISKGKLESFVTSDNYQAGYLDGEFLASELGNKKVLNVIIVEYPHISSTVSRVDGFIDAFEAQNIKYKIVKRYEAVEPVKGREVGRQILKDFPKVGSVDVIFTVNDGGGLAVVEELSKAKRTEIAVATVDGDDRSVENIKKKNLTRIDTAQFCGPMGAAALRTAYDRLNGKPISKEILVPVFPITAKTMSFYPGWLGPIPKPFNKPWSSIKPVWDGKLISK